MDGSGHGMNRSGHASSSNQQGMNRSGHGRSSLGFKAKQSGADPVMITKRSGSAKRSQWAEVLTPTVLSHDANPK
jgi:hypothetical protein